jgi:hypothetical protein
MIIMKGTGHCQGVNQRDIYLTTCHPSHRSFLNCTFIGHALLNPTRCRFADIPANPAMAMPRSKGTIKISLFPDQGRAGEQQLLNLRVESRNSNLAATLAWSGDIKSHLSPVLTRFSHQLHE